MNLTHDLADNVLTFHLEGELNSYNSEEVEKQLDSIIQASTFNAIRMDMDKLVYISSAGLRIIVRLKQMYDDLALINVDDSVYSIFEMVGFNSILKIERK